MSEYFYTLKGHEVVPCSNREWSAMFSDFNRRRVASTKICGARVSTVFLGLDHSLGDEPPTIFESLVFGGPLDQLMQRYATWDEAEKGHAEMVQAVKEASPFAPEDTPKDGW